MLKAAGHKDGNYKSYSLVRVNASSGNAESPVEQTHMNTLLESDVARVSTAKRQTYKKKMSRPILLTTRAEKYEQNFEETFSGDVPCSFVGLRFDKQFVDVELMDGKVTQVNLFDKVLM